MNAAVTSVLQTQTAKRTRSAFPPERGKTLEENAPMWSAKHIPIALTNSAVTAYHITTNAPEDHSPPCSATTTMTLAGQTKTARGLTWHVCRIGRD
jgi:hypothetical protein